MNKLDLTTMHQAYSMLILGLEKQKVLHEEKPFAVLRNVVEFRGTLKTNPATRERGNLAWCNSIKCTDIKKVRWRSMHYLA